MAQKSKKSLFIQLSLSSILVNNTGQKSISVSEMAKIAYILLCHKDPVSIIKQAERLTAAGDYMSIHFDRNADPLAFTQVFDALMNNPQITFARKRLRCGWGEWSLVQATLYAVAVSYTHLTLPTTPYV